MICSVRSSFQLISDLRSPGRKVTAPWKDAFSSLIGRSSSKKPGLKAFFGFITCVFCPKLRQLNPLSYRWNCGAAAWAGREWDPSHPEAQQRHHLDGAQRERRVAAPAGDEDKDEDQQGGRGETGSAQTGETSLHMGLPAGCTGSAVIVKFKALAHKGPFLLAQFVTFCNRKHAFHQQQSWRICLWLCSNASTVSLV